jgi:hypothetical protein
MLAELAFPSPESVAPIVVYLPAAFGNVLTADVMQYPHPDRWGTGIRG